MHIILYYIHIYIMNIKYVRRQLKVTVHVFIIVGDIGIPSIRFRNQKDPIWMNG